MADPEDDKKSQVDQNPSAPDTRADTAVQPPDDKPWQAADESIPEDKPWNDMDSAPDDKPWEGGEFSPEDKPWDDVFLPESPIKECAALESADLESADLVNAAARTPTDEATLHLQMLLDTVGDAGLRATFSLPEPEPEAPAPELATPEPVATKDQNLADDDNAQDLQTTQGSTAELAAPLSEDYGSTPESEQSNSQFEWNFNKADSKKKNSKKTSQENPADSEQEGFAPFNLKANTRKTHRTKQHKTARRPYIPEEEADPEASAASASSLKNLAEALTDLNADLAESAPTEASESEILTDLASALESVVQEDPLQAFLRAGSAGNSQERSGSTESSYSIDEDYSLSEEEFQAEVQEEPVQAEEEASSRQENAGNESIEKPQLQLETINDSRQQEELLERKDQNETMLSHAREVDLGLEADDDYTGFDSLAQRAQNNLIGLPEPHTAESLDELSVMLPGDPDDEYCPVTLGEFARSTGMTADELNSYYEIIFLKMTSKRLRREAKGGLLYEIQSGKNPAALKVLQELSAIQAAVLLKEAEQQNNARAILAALCRLAFLEKSSKTAAEILQGSHKKERIAPHPLTEYARKAARYLRINDYQDAIDAFGVFLERNSELDIESRQAQRAEAIECIEQAASKMLNTLANDEYLQLSRKLNSINAILLITETDRPKMAGGQLHNLQEWKEIDKSAAAFIAHIEKQIENQPGISRLKDIETDLTHNVVQPLKLIKACLPDLEDELNELRLEQIKQALTPESSSIEFEEASKKLDNELRYGNEAASQELRWIRTGQTVRRISETIQNRKLNDLESVKLSAETIKVEMDRLCQLFYANNIYARNALLGMLLHTAEPRILESWRLTQERATLCPDLSLLSQRELSIITEHVALVFNESQKTNPDSFKLRLAEARGLANVLAKFNSRRERPVQKALEAIFITAFKGRYKSVAVDGLLSGRAYEIPDYATFTNLIKHAIADGAMTGNHLKQLGALARQSVTAAIATLGSIARGVLDTTQAESAASQLLEAAALPDNRKSLLKVLVQEYDREGDKACLLSTIGEIAASETQVDFKVIETLRVAFESSSKTPYSALYKSAARGFFRVAGKWQEREILTLSRNLRSDTLRSIGEVASQISSECCDSFLEIQHENLVRGKAEDRLNAIQVVAALLKYASPALVRDLSRDLKFYSSLRGETELQRAGLVKEKLQRFVELAKSALADSESLPSSKRAHALKEPLITPFEAREALDKAGSVVGDSLHSSTPGHEETRKTYEGCIQSGIMSIADARKLLVLPLEDRLIIESMLKDDELLPETFAALIKLDAPVINKLFSVPPRIASSVLLPALAAGVIADQSMQTIVQLDEPQRQATLDFLQRSIDRTHPLTAEHLHAFTALPPTAQLEFAKALEQELQENSRALTAAEIMEVLSSPVRTVSGRAISDAAVLAEALEKDILNSQQLNVFARLDDTARAGISGMLKGEALDKQLAKQVFELMEKGDWTGPNLRDLGVAALLDWLPKGFLKELLAEDLTLQKALFERLSIEAPQGKPGEFSLQAFLKRLQSANKWLKEGVINKPALHLLGKQHASDILLMNLIQTQATKPADERIGPDNILQLIMQIRTNKMNSEALETYRAGLEKGLLSKQNFKLVFAQRPEQRIAAEHLLRSASDKFFELASQGLFRDMPEAAQSVRSAARQVFPEALPEQGKYDVIDMEGLSISFKNVLTGYLEVLSAGNTISALTRLAAQVESREMQTQLGIRMVLKWNEAELDFSRFNEIEDLQRLRSIIQEQNREGIPDDAESDFVQVAAVEPIVHILKHHKFRLRDANNICEDGNWRACKQHERVFLESIQNTEAARAILAKIGLQLAQDWLSKEAEAKQKLAEEQKPIVVRELSPGNFRSIMSDGRSRMEFPNGMFAEVTMNPAAFMHLEEAFTGYLTGLRKASKARGRRRETAMEELIKGFEKKIPHLLEACGVKMIRSTQSSYMIPIFQIELAKDYLPPGSISNSEPIDLNLQQGLRRFLGEHASGKIIYEELARTRYSGITPKYDPAPPGRKPAAINPADQRSLSSKQRSAIATSILNDFSGLYQGCHKQEHDSPVKAELEMSVLKVGAGRNFAEEAFDRAEQWSHLMYILNNFSPLSAGGNKISELYDAGEFNDLHCDRETLLMENDYIQMMLEFGIVPEKWMFDVHGYYRQEVDDRLKKGPSDFMTEIGLVEIAEGEDFTPTEIFDRGEPVFYNDEEYRVIARESGKLLIRYEGQAREPAPASPRQVTDMELETKYTPVQANNKIHFLSNSANDPAIYILSCNDKGAKLLHTDSALRFVSADLVQPRESRSAQSRAGRELSFTAEHLPASARKLFDTFKEFGIVIDGQGISLAGKQETIGSGDDAGIKIADPKNQLSSRHLQLLFSGKMVSVQDLNSSNGTFLNWKRLRPYETVSLRTCDQVNLGALDGPELSLFCKPKESSTGRNHKVMVGSKTLTPDRSLSIGRLPSADVFVSYPSVSRIQATIRMNAEGKVLIKDGTAQVPSASGLVINGKPLIPGAEIELRPSDRVSTGTGVELPIRFVEKSKVNIDMNAEKTMGRFAIKNSSLREMLAGVDAQHGVYALAHRIKKKLQTTGCTLHKNGHGPRTQAVYALRKAPEALKQRLKDAGAVKNEGFWQKPILTARGSLSDAALRQSNMHADSEPISERLEDGWCNAGKGIRIEKTGKFNLSNRIATAVNRAQDHVLRGVIDDVKRRFSSLLPEVRCAALTEYARELLTPKDMTPDQLDQWFDQFSQDHDGKRVLLGEFIKEGKGVSIQQAALLKVLADEFDDLQCKLVRGMGGNHSWTTFTFDGIEYIHDPRGRFISAIAGVEGASPKAVLWIPDSEAKSSAKGELKLGNLVSFDATSGWRIISMEPQSDEIIIGSTGCRLVSSADLMLANPERALLIIGEKYNIPRPDGLLDHGLSAWTLHSISRDGNLRMVKPGSIQVRVRKDQVRLRITKS